VLWGLECQNNITLEQTSNGENFNKNEILTLTYSQENDQKVHDGCPMAKINFSFIWDVFTGDRALPS